MTRPRYTSIALSALLVFALTAGAAAPAAADHDNSSSLADGLQPSDDGLLGAALGLLGGVDRAKYAIFGPDDSAAENRDAAINEFNQHNESFVAYANNRSIHEGDVLQIDCVIDGETATGYIVATYNDSSEAYESAEAVETTDRTADHTIELRKNACDNAADELERFHADFASEDKDVTRKYMAEMASKYKGNVDEPFTGGA